MPYSLATIHPLRTDKRTDKRTDDNHANSSTVIKVRSAENDSAFALYSPTVQRDTAPN